MRKQYIHNHNNSSGNGNNNNNDADDEKINRTKDAMVEWMMCSSDDDDVSIDCMVDAKVLRIVDKSGWARVRYNARHCWLGAALLLIPLLGVVGVVLGVLGVVLGVVLEEAVRSEPLDVGTEIVAGSYCKMSLLLLLAISGLPTSPFFPFSTGKRMLCWCENMFVGSQCNLALCRWEGHDFF